MGSGTIAVLFVVLLLSHVGMFAAGVAAFQILRWVNARSIYPKPAITEEKLQQMANRMMQKQAKDAYAWLNRFEGPPSPLAEGVQSYTPKPPDNGGPK